MEKPKAPVGRLESELLQIVDQHNQTSLRIRDQTGAICGKQNYTMLYTEKSKKEAIRSAIHVSQLLVDSVNGGAEDIFVNEKHIEFEIRSLICAIMRYSKQTNQWLAATRALNTALKEIGDFENWVKTMDYDCKSITAAVCNIHQT
ncbi:biogenesis of lysosome-related organelles complex 1 subunit 1-like isoform X1 [Aristolochia californica]|uniref:biogenesis of lysosome-related organelles complex 1 subunit 1-like isoform X1 n=1 Tax=Aristolochia californica TaxID=171875 RepID=UPI0035D5CDD3